MQVPEPLTDLRVEDQANPEQVLAGLHRAGLAASGFDAVHTTDEFALVRFDGDAERADAVYAGVAEPLTADDVAEAICWMATRPAHVNIDELVIRPRAQAAQHKVHRV